MPTSIPLKRIVTCGGTIQLVTALSVIAYRSKEENSPINEYENYLVIYDLYAPAEQINDFVVAIGKIATSLCTWKSIVYITPEQLATISDKLNTTAVSAIFETVYDWVGTSTAAEIYMGPNLSFGSQLLIDAYSAAIKICYGDSIGIYFSRNSPAFFPVQKAPPLSLREKLVRSFFSVPKQLIRRLLNNIQERLRLKTVLKVIEFDRGYFTLPDVMGEVPPMAYKKINVSYILGTVRSLIGLVNADYVSQLQSEIGDAPVAVLLTSNFSEAGRMSYESELSAYFQFLSSANILPNTVLAIKPHPRDNLKKIQQLQGNLIDLIF